MGLSKLTRGKREREEIMRTESQLEIFRQAASPEGEKNWREVRTSEAVSFGLSSRVIEGTAWVVKDLSQLEEVPDPLPGDVLVVPGFTWENWFNNIANLQRFKAIVAEEGGLLHHPAIVMREVGFVCFTVPNLFEQVKNGDSVRIEVESASFRNALHDVGYYLKYRNRLPPARYPRDAKLRFFVLQK